MRYIGITTSHGRDHEELALALETSPFDFVQLSYNLVDREAERRLLPLAQERGIAVLANRPFQRGALFQSVRGKALPDWAAEFDCTSWAQFSQVRRIAPGRDLRDTRLQQGEPPGRQHGCRYRPAAGCSAAQTHGRLHRADLNRRGPTARLPAGTAPAVNGRDVTREPVIRNAPCPDCSGKKYKKCCGAGKLTLH